MDWQNSHPHHILEVLSSLSYGTGTLDDYLREIASGVSQLLSLDWSVVTLCREDEERVMASSLDMGEGDHIYSLHGTLSATVVKTGQSLCVEDAVSHPEYGAPPEGYRSYLGIPLRTSTGETIGTICSFCIKPRQFEREEVKTAELFAERAATAIDNYLLYQQKCRFNEFLEAEVAKRTEELKLAQAQLIERERLAAIGEFAAMIVHEIRNPVTTILMGLNYFERTYTSERDRARISLALDEAHRLQSLLQEIMLYAKPQVLQLENLEVNQLLEQMLPNLQEMTEAQEREIKIIPSISPIAIVADKDKLKQVMINLVRNAYEAISPGEFVTCTIELMQDSSQVGIRIHNGGIPIPADILPKLTQPFCSSKSGGTGLGLAIVKRIVEAHGGKLSIESDTLRGTTIQFTVPILSVPIHP